MKKIVLVCVAGMSTSLLVNKMREAAKELNYKCEISACPMAQAEEAGKTADILLLGPQVSFNLDNIQKMLPDIPIEVIDIKDYGSMNGRKLLEEVMEKLG